MLEWICRPCRGDCCTNAAIYWSTRVTAIWFGQWHVALHAWNNFLGGDGGRGLFYYEANYWKDHMFEVSQAFIYYGGDIYGIFWCTAILHYRFYIYMPQFPIVQSHENSEIKSKMNNIIRPTLLAKLKSEWWKS